MDSITLPSPPITSDPAFFNDWEEQSGSNPLPSNTDSDDFEALHLIQQEATEKKNQAREVIQHRAWPLGEAFRSEADHLEGFN